MFMQAQKVLPAHSQPGSMHGQHIPNIATLPHVSLHVTVSATHVMQLCLTVMQVMMNEGQVTLNQVQATMNEMQATMNGLQVTMEEVQVTQQHILAGIDTLESSRTTCQYH
jgi:hypothetical protein